MITTSVGDMSGRRVVVTGASRGIGYAVAQAYATAGAIVHLVAETGEVLEAAKRLAGPEKLPVTGHVADITDYPTVNALASSIPPPDVLVNNAGLELLTWLDDDKERTLQRVDQITRINLLGTWLVTQAFVARMGRGSSIICTASIWSHTAEPGFSAYAASKHGTLGLVRAWARELGPRGIRVNAVAPGWVRTKAAERSLDHMAEITGRSKDSLLEEIERQQSLGGIMEPGDIAGAFLFLASDDARSITGQSIQVDRGAIHA
ncbi:MAG: SDR family oxidoreductase [Methyloceanibacter sp.]|nr:SDR family oxidoreductase [Methyloceanibacter sp.]